MTMRTSRGAAISFPDMAMRVHTGAAGTSFHGAPCQRPARSIVSARKRGRAQPRTPRSRPHRGPSANLRTENGARRDPRVTVVLCPLR